MTGARRYQARLPGEVVRAATFDADGFSPTLPASEAGAAPDVVATLGAIVADPDKRFPDLKLFAIEEIGRQPGREATGKLLEILGGRGLPPLAVQKTSEALAARRDTQSADLLAAALRVHADYAEGRTAPPIDFLARAVAALGPSGRSVWPELVAQLRQPETPTPAAAQIARALIATGAEEAIPALRDFLTMYRADPAHDADPSALIAVSEALIKLGGAGDRRLLLFVAEEPHTVAPLRAHLVRALGETDPGSRKDGDAGLTSPHRLTVVVCRGPTCGDKRGSGALAARLAETVKARGLEDRVHVVDEVCLGHCLRGPNILVQEEGAADEPFGGVLYNRMTVEDLDRVIEKHLVGGMAVRILMNRPPVKDR